MAPPSKPKSKFPKRNHHGKAQQTSSPAAAETADDHLDQCIFLEESGDKWRAGDAAKAARFYVRALQAYDEGLARFGRGGSGGGVNFDMAYNKARLQYQVTQHPAVSAQFPLSLDNQLRSALESHRLALQIEPSNTDVLFNTAQTLTSLAEAVQEIGQESNDGAEEAVTVLREAIILFQQCLATQEALYEQNVRQTSEAPSMETDAAAEDVPGASEPSNTTKSDTTEERWASIVEPVTLSSLQDTALALLDALGSLSLALPLQDEPGLEQVKELGQIVVQKLPVYLDDADQDTRRTAWLTITKFATTICEAEFKHGVIELRTYDQRIKDAFEIAQTDNAPPGLAGSSPFLCCYADTLIAFSAAIANRLDTAVLRWTRLTKALECLTLASKIPRVEDLSSLHVGMGDVELLRHMLCLTSDLPDNLSNTQVQNTLLKNAKVYYRGALTLAQSSMRRSEDDVYASATIKRAVVASMLESSNNPLVQLRTSGITDTSIKKVIQEMVDESLVLGDRIQALL